MKYPNRILAVRTDKDIYQEELAVTSGISQQMINLYEKGSSLPNVVVAELVAEYLGTTVRNLYEETIKDYIAEAGVNADLK